MASGDAVAAEIETALVSPEFNDDPYPVYRHLQETSPVYWSKSLNRWLITGYDTALSAFHMPEVLSSNAVQVTFFEQLPPATQALCPLLRAVVATPTIVFSDPPIHTRLRRLVNRRFTPRAISAMRESLTRVSCELVTTLAESPSMDVVDGLALQLPLRGILEILGAHPDEGSFYKRVSDARQAFAGDSFPDPVHARTYESALVELRDHLSSLFVGLAESSDGGLLDALNNPDDISDELDTDELFHLSLVLLSAGHTTTTAAIGNAIWSLLLHRDQMQRVREDPALTAAAFEEALRWQPPVKGLRRRALSDLELGGQTIHTGDDVVIFLAAANRDSSKFSDPDRFDIDRNSTSHLGLGHGIHFCVGASLARLEAVTAIQTLITELPPLALPHGWTPQWNRSLLNRSMRSLPVLVADE